MTWTVWGDGDDALARQQAQGRVVGLGDVRDGAFVDRAGLRFLSTTGQVAQRWGAGGLAAAVRQFGSRLPKRPLAYGDCLTRVLCCHAHMQVALKGRATAEGEGPYDSGFHGEAKSHRLDW
ncbi:hypothetical protein ACIBJF_42855 [Streptomyces sp. NPDC050743]|uniref:hypothetical protein n=1 Tax=Streptomyces sp. NPDC050743 TaxID=3365634 RepID=UPI0037BDFE47